MQGVNLSSVVNIASTSDTYTFNDDVKLKFGTGGTASIQWQTDDANANVLAVLFPEGGATDVPIMVIADATGEKDLAMFNGFAQPGIAVIDDDADTSVILTFKSDDAPILRSSGNTVSIGTSYTYHLTVNHANNVPTLYGTGAYCRIGDASTTANSLDSEDDLLVTGETELQTVFINGVNGLDFNPGSDTNVDLITINVTDTPIFRWHESNNRWEFSNKGLYIQGNFFPGANIQMINTGMLYGTNTDNDYYDLGAYDVDGSAYTSVIRIQNANIVELGFFGATPVAQQAHIADATGDDATEVNAILDVLEAFGLVATL